MGFLSIPWVFSLFNVFSRIQLSGVSLDSPSFEATSGFPCLAQLVGSQKVITFHFQVRVWLKIKELGLRRFESWLRLPRVPFW